MKTTLYQLEEYLIKQGKRGYVDIRLWDGACIRSCQIGYFEDIAKYHGLSYKNSMVEYVEAE